MTSPRSCGTRQAPRPGLSEPRPTRLPFPPGLQGEATSHSRQNRTFVGPSLVNTDASRCGLWERIDRNPAGSARLPKARPRTPASSAPRPWPQSSPRSAASSSISWRCACGSRPSPGPGAVKRRLHNAASLRGPISEVDCRLPRHARWQATVDRRAAAYLAQLTLPTNATGTGTHPGRSARAPN